MSMAMRFRRERTNMSSKPSVTLTAPGNVTIPYGKGQVFVSGRGMAGNPASPGNYANTNAPVPGTVRYNPPTPSNTVLTPGNTVPARYSPGNTNEPTYVPGTTSYSARWTPQGAGGSCPIGWAPMMDGQCLAHFSNGTNPGTYAPGNTNPGYYAPAYTNPPSYFTNPVVPGNVIYNPTIPSAQKYNPVTPGTSVYVPSTRYGSSWVSSFDMQSGAYDESYGDWSGDQQPTSGWYFYGNITGQAAYTYDGMNAAYSYVNPSTPGNAVYNPVVPGNLSYNPSNGGNSGTNPARPFGSSYTAFYDTVNKATWYSNTDHPWGPSNVKPAAYTYSANPGYPGNSRVNFNIDGYTPGNRYTNPVVPGNAYYNPSTPSTAVYNPAVPASPTYNPDVPGTMNYNPPVPGNAGTPMNVLGVDFPGGGVGQTAPMVGARLVKVPSGALPINVSYGGSVTIDIK